MNSLKNIVILGGGTSGFISAFILKKKIPSLDIQIIKSSKIDIIGVGEGSTENFTKFIEFVDIDYIDLVKHCGATYKAGIMFKNWSEENFLQIIGDGFNFILDGYPSVYAHLIKNQLSNDLFVPEHALNSKVNTYFLQNKDISPTLQFHFDNFKLNSYFEQLATERGIKIIYDDIENVTLDTNGNIEKIESKTNTFYGDFFIDASGFKKFLINKLGFHWQSWSEYLKLNSAFTFQTDALHKINMYTVAQAMDSGWMFTIPLVDRNGNGYIYDNSFTTLSDAKAEVESLLGQSIDVNREFNFDPGYVKNPWIKNCCAIGLSSSFVEPLEASSIGVTIEQSFLLARLLINYNTNVIAKYNDINEKILENVRDFISLHYITKKVNSPFWKNINENLILSPKLSELLEIWKNKLPSRSDFYDYSPYCLFSEFHFILILNGLKLLNLDNIKLEYQAIVDQNTELEILNILERQRTLICDTIPHRLMLECITTMKKENYE